MAGNYDQFQLSLIRRVRKQNNTRRSNTVSSYSANTFCYVGAEEVNENKRQRLKRFRV